MLLGIETIPTSSQRRQNTKDMTKDPIKLRRRKTRTGRESLYLDIYIDGRRSYEYLHLYLEPETDRATKERNRQVMMLAEAVRAKRVVEFQNGRFGFNKDGGEDTLFAEYYRGCMERYGENREATRGTWEGCLNHLEVYAGRSFETLTFRDITAEWVDGFRDYLTNRAVSLKNKDQGEKCSRQGLGEVTCSLYLSKLMACINRAYEQGIIPRKPARLAKSDRIDMTNIERVYLTREELQAMVNTPFEGKWKQRLWLRRAFLFCCLTGLRKSDIEAMRWRQIREENGYTRIVFEQVKTRKLEYLDITPEAREYMGKRGADGDLVFRDFKYGTPVAKYLREWAQKAGVNKPLVFHSSRHTFATLMVSLKTDIYTVSKLLGHADVKTTQIYASIVDAAKREAVARIPSFNDPLFGKKDV